MRCEERGERVGDRVNVGDEGDRIIFATCSPLREAE